ncbi:MAG: LamG domain-containing protein [Cyanobacteria bacterium J06592_8]
MLSLEKLRLAVAGVSITYPLPVNNRSAHQAAPQANVSPSSSMQETLHDDALPNASTFDGVTDKMDMPYSPDLNPASFTVEMWVMPEGGTGYQSIIASVAGSPLSGRQGYLFCITPSWQWQFWLGNGEEKEFWHILTGPQVRPNSWAHLAGTYDQRSEAMTFYVNGQEVGRQIGVQYHPNDSNPTRIGASVTEQRGVSPCFFCGKIAEVHVWDRVLTPTEIQALSTHQSIEVQVEPITDSEAESTEEYQTSEETVTSPMPMTEIPETYPVEPDINPATSVQEHPQTSPTLERERPLTQTPGTSQQQHQSDSPVVLWQIGQPGQGGIPTSTGAWTQVYNYTIGTDRDPLNHPTIPACLVPVSANSIANSTSQLNIVFVVTEDYTENQLVFCYDRYGSGEDYLFLDGQLIASTPGASNQLKQSQIRLGAVSRGAHTLSITVSNRADSAHIIDYLQLHTFKPMLSNLLSSNHPSQSGSNQPESQNPQAQASQGGGLLGGAGGLLGPVTGIVEQATGVVGGLAGGAGNPAELLGQVTGVVGGLAGGAGNPAELLGQVTGVVGGLAGGAGNPAELLGQVTGAVGGLAGQATGVVGGLAGQATGLVGGLAGQATGVVGGLAGGAGNPAELLGQVTGTVGGLAGQATGVVGGLAGQAAGFAGQATGMGGNLPNVASVQAIAQLAQLVSQMSVLVTQMSQVINQLATVPQPTAQRMLPPQQIPQAGGLSQQGLILPPQLVAQLANQSPQLLSQLQQLAQMYQSQR